MGKGKGKLEGTVLVGISKFGTVRNCVVPLLPIFSSIFGPISVIILRSVIHNTRYVHVQQALGMVVQRHVDNANAVLESSIVTRASVRP